MLWNLRVLNRFRSGVNKNYSKDKDIILIVKNQKSFVIIKEIKIKDITVYIEG